MASRVRWRKLAGDLRAMRGRLVAMVAALAVSLVGFGAVLGARTVLRREISTSYLSSHPADATLELAGDIDAATLAAVRARPEVAEAEPRASVLARVTLSSPAAWQLLQLFVIDDFAALPLNTFRRESGAWPPPTGTLLLERSAAAMLGASEGDTAVVKTPHGAARSVAISGIVHDAGLAPAWQERKGYAYVTRETIAALGEPAALRELRVAFRPAPATRGAAEAAATALAGWLAGAGHAVHEIRVPELRKHPHEAQMATAQMALLVFSALLFVLSAVLVATLLSAMLARQVREIGVMKALGARTGQLAAMYATAVAAIGAVACVVALPLGALGARALIGGLAGMLNLAVSDASIPPWVFAVQAAAGVAVPLALAAWPIQRACRLTVRAALAQHGVGREVLRPSLARLPMPVRAALRQPGRLALSLALLTCGGVIATTAFNVKRAYEANLERMPEMWHHDLEIRLAEPAPVALAAVVAAVPGVRIAEPWGFGAAAFTRSGGVDVVHTYPDQGHGSFPVLGVPPHTALFTPPLVAGRWLADGEDGADHAADHAIVVSAMTGRRVGDTLELSLDGAAATWTVVGIVDTLPAGGGYVTAAAFARAAHTDGKARMLRIATTARSAAELRTIQAGIERALAREGAMVDGAIAFSTLRDAMDAHALILTRVALALSAIIALVGLIGLAASVGIAVVTRTREIGIMKAIGAGDRRIFRLVVGEAILVGLASWLASALLAIPLTVAVDGLLSSLGFLAARVVISPAALAGWLGFVVVGSWLAALAPARRAARLTVREALAAA